MEYEPQEGIDYIVDLYAVAGVDRDAAEADIQQSLRKRMMEYHPDRLEGLAPEFRDRGEVMARVLNRANVVLLDAEKRREYDEILDDWTGLISENGVPVVSLDRVLQAEFHGKTPDEVEEFFAQQGAKIQAMTGYSPQRLEFLQNLIDSAKKTGEKLPDGLQDEYEAALLLRDRVLAVEEKERADLLGIPASTDQRYATTRNYAQLVAGKIEETRQTRQEEAERLAIGGTATRLALLAGEDTASADNLPAAPTKLEALPPYFDNQAARIQEIAQEREEVLESRLSNLSLTYPLEEEQTLFTKKLALGIEGKEDMTWICVEVNDDDTGTGATLPEEIENLLLREDFHQVIGHGYNVATFKLMDQIDLRDLVRVAAGKYTDEFPQSTVQQ